MKTAVIKTGGKQYLVQEGQALKVEKLETEEGKNITFNEVLLTVNDDTTTVGMPFVKGAKVKGKVVSHGKSDKVYGVKMKAKKRNKKYFGHRQNYTEIEITAIG